MTTLTTSTMTSGMTARVTLSTSKTSTKKGKKTIMNGRYTLAYRPLMTVNFDEHGNCRGHILDMSQGAEYAYDTLLDEAFEVTELPHEVREVVEEYVESLELVRFFQPGPEPDAPF